MSESQQGMNPNTPVTSEPVTAQVDQGGSVSFEAMERITEEQIKESKKPAKEKASEEPKLEAKEKEKSPEAKLEGAKKEQVEEEKKASPEKAGEEQKASSQDTSMVEVTIDGKKTQVPLQELINQYSGKVAWDKKFTDLDKERKSFQAEKQRLDSQVKDFFEKSEKDPKSAIKALAEMAGENPVKFMRDLRERLIPELVKYAEMSEAERRAADLAEENEYLKTRAETESRKLQEQQTKQELLEQVESIQKAHNLSFEQVKGLYTEIAEILPEDQITPEKLGEYHVLKGKFNQVNSVLEATDPKLVEDTALVGDLVNYLMDNPELTDADLADIVEQAFGKRASTKALKKKVEAAAKSEGLSANPEKSSITSTKNPGSDPLSFEDL